jgi:TolA-binding protein
MTDRTPEQTDAMIDRTLAISAENTSNISVIQQQIGSMAGAIEQLALATNRRLQQHDLELDDHDVRVEQLERDRQDHLARMARLEDIQADLRGMMQLLTRRLTGEPPEGET